MLHHKYQKLIVRLIPPHTPSELGYEATFTGGLVPRRLGLQGAMNHGVIVVEIERQQWLDVTEKFILSV